MKKLSFLYPFLFALYPILALKNYNAEYVDGAAIIRPMIVSLAATLIFWALYKIIVKQNEKASILAALTIALFFLYGHVFALLQKQLGDSIHHRSLIIFFAFLLGAAIYVVARKVKDAKSLSAYLSTIVVMLFGLAFSQFVWHDYNAYLNAAKIRDEQARALQNIKDTSNINKPDIYLILLDAHTRSDILKDYFDVDNTPFINALKKMGFYVAECAQSNYPSTKFSLSATFYGKYHDSLELPPLSSSFAIQTVRSLGYKVVTFENRASGQFDINEDIHLSRNQLALGQVDLTGGLSEFESMLIQTSVLKIFYDMPQLVPGLNLEYLQHAEYYEHYQQTYFILNKLKEVPTEIDSPKFVFAHILVPHDPFIFKPNGDFFWALNRKQGYADNIRFIDSQIAPVVEAIIKNSKTTPIIVIMGDHGAPTIGVNPDEDLKAQKRMSILNAYFVNEKTKAALYPKITPINTFRIIFNNYFGTNYPLLEDLSYHSYNMNRFTPEYLVPNLCQPTH